MIQNEFNEYDFDQGNKLKEESPCESKQEKGKGLKGGSPLESPCICDRPKEKKNPPKIYFCTRTHRQIAQIIRELNKTEFRQVRILISNFWNNTYILYKLPPNLQDDTSKENRGSAAPDFYID